MKAGITGFGAYIPWRRMNRGVIAKANAWIAPGIKGNGHRSLANWDEDAITMAVAASRDLLGDGDRRKAIEQVILASTTLPFADRLNSGVLVEALNLPEEVKAQDVTGSQLCALSALSQALSVTETRGGSILLAAAENRKTRAASSQEMSYGDAAAAITLGQEGVIAECLGEATQTTDFVDHFRMAKNDIDYHWEERWVRDEGISTFLPNVIGRALKQADVSPETVDYFIFPSIYSRMDQKLAAVCGLTAESVVDNFSATVGDSGSSHGLLMLAQVLEVAKPGQTIVLSQFGSGACAMVFRVTDAIDSFAPVRGVEGWLSRAFEETNYMRFLVYKNQLDIEKGMRGEQDRKTVLSTSYRYRKALLGFIAGRCSVSGNVHFPPSRISYTPGSPEMNTQEPYPLADKKGKVLSWSAEWLSSYMAPPHQYGQVDFIGGGRVLMEFTDVQKGDIETGCEVEMVFRVKDIDEMRGYKRYFWKATPVKHLVSTLAED